MVNGESSARAAGSGGEGFAAGALTGPSRRVFGGGTARVRFWVAWQHYLKSRDKPINTSTRVTTDL